jgi:hypothetical protein
VSNSGRTPLLEAILKGRDFEISKMLIYVGADVNYSYFENDGRKTHVLKDPI